MPTGKPAIRVFYKNAGKAVDLPICIPVKKQNYAQSTRGSFFLAVLTGIGSRRWFLLLYTEAP
jgi:hypothetical protein